MKLTLLEARAQLYSAVVPNLTGDTNGIPNVDIFDQALNFACERLINDGTWLNQYEHVRFLVDNDFRYITLPPEFASIQAISIETQNNDTGCVIRTAVQLLNEWVSVLSPGPFLWNWSLWPMYGFQPAVAFSNDLGDGFVIFRDSPYATYRLRFELENVEDNGIEVLVKGKDADGLEIYTPSSGSAYQGVTFALSYPSTTPTQIFSSQIYFLHKPLTQGYVRLYAQDTITSEETLIGIYRPSEVNPCYKRYSVRGNCGCNANSNQVLYVRGICKRRFVPMIHPTDTVIPPNFGALRTALTAIIYEQQNDGGRRDQEFAKAIELLNSELRSSRGGSALRVRIDSTSSQFGNLWAGR